MVQLLRITYEVKLAEGKQNQGMSRPPVFTDEDGEFEFRAVPEQGVNLLVSGDTILFTGVLLSQEHDVEDIVMVVTQRLHLQVELDPPHSRVDQMRVLDADGVPVVLNVMQGEGSFHGPEMPVLDGHSAVITVDDAAATLVLLREGKEVARLPLALAPGEPNVVRY